MAELKPADGSKLLGAGRSGQVFLVKTESGSIARKVFTGDTPTNLIHYIFSGAPNPYIWNEDALKCCYYRRKIVADLVKVWFGSRLLVSDAIAPGWNDEFKAFQLDTAFIQGREVALRHPFDNLGEHEAHDLLHHIMQPLQKRLIQAGVDGLVWQAGKGNPVAFNNFLLVENDSEQRQFALIDLESGVPAIVPLNPLPLFFYYLPKSFKHGHALFDDVDIAKLKKYINHYRTFFETDLGDRGYWNLLENIDYLEEHQIRWRSLSRLERGIEYQLKKGYITSNQASWYKKHPLSWYKREAKRGTRKIFGKMLELPAIVWQWLRTLSVKGLATEFWKLLSSRQHRLNIARNHVTRRIHYWENRKQLQPEEAEFLLNRVHNDYANDYLTDFGVHLGMKIFVKLIEYTVGPLLFALGLIDEIALGLFLLMGGAVSRTLYTSFRMIQARAEGKEIPWIAFFLGMIPLMIGNIAYPCQMVCSATGKQGRMARFVVYDFMTMVGEKIPIWGGEGTLTEHVFNQWAAHLIHHATACGQLLAPRRGGSRA